MTTPRVPPANERPFPEEGTGTTGPGSRPGLAPDPAGAPPGLEAPLESDATFRVAMEHSPIGMALAAPDGRLLRVNRALARLLGRDEASLAGCTWQDVTHPEDLGNHLEMVRDALEGRLENFQMRKRYLRPDGTVVWGDLSVACIRDAASRPRGFVSQVVDVTESVLAKEALRESEAKLVAAQRIAHVGSWILGPGAGGAWWSDEMYRIFGLEVADSPPPFSTHQEVFTPETRGPLARAIGTALETLEPWEITVGFLHPDGRVHYAVSRGEATREADGRVVLHGTFADVTALHEAQERLARAQRVELVGRLAGGVAHEFNNLLMAINGYAEFVAESLAEDDPLRDDVLAIRQAGIRAALLTRQLLAFGRRQTLRPVLLDLSEVILEMAPMLRSLVGERVGLALPSAELDWRVRADRTTLESALTNLVLNARDAMPAGGLLTLEVAPVTLGPGARPPARPGEFVRVSVSDTGTGIAPEDLPHLFEPFFTRKEPGHGAGLGLSSVEGIVSQSGGFVTVDTKPGAGSTFSIHLPRSAGSPAEAASPSPASARAPLRTRILVVDDDPSVRLVTARMLRALGHEVVDLGDPVEALERARGASEAFDLLVTDVMMPGMDGCELGRRLQAHFPGLRILYMSGYSSETLFGDGLLEEGTPYLNKPFSAEELLTRVRAALGLEGTVR